MKRIVIRADANKDIGMGHVMRTLSIADAARLYNCQVEFLIADKAISELIQSRGYKVRILESDYTKMDEELCLWPQDLEPDILIIDSYYVTDSYLSFLREKMNKTGGELVYIDDLFAFPYPVDILVNYNAFAAFERYEELYGSFPLDVPRLILGTTYAPLRSMFKGVEKKNQKHKVEDVLISTGGADELHLALSILQELIKNKSSNRVYHFLVGAMNTDREVIHELADKQEHIVIHENVSDMKSLIQSMDIAVSAAGSTVYEIASCGVPLITYSLADNQILGADSFVKLGLGVNVGDLRDPDSVDSHAVMGGVLSSTAVVRILSAIEILSEDWNGRIEMGTRMQELIDGFGADRMVQRILELVTLGRG